MRFQKNFIRTAGAILGAGLALAFLVAARPSPISSPLPAALRVSVASTGELEVTPASQRPILVADPLLPGGKPAAGAFQLRNQTGTPLAIGLKATADSTALDGVVRLRLSARGETIADTTLRGMRQRPPTLELGSGIQRRLRLEIWIPSGIRTGYEGRRVKVSLVPSGRTLGGPR